MDTHERNHEALIDRFDEQARIIRHRNDRIAEVEARANELALELAHAATRAEKAEQERDEARRHEGVAAEQATEQARLAQQAMQDRHEADARAKGYAATIDEQRALIDHLRTEQPQMKGSGGRYNFLVMPDGNACQHVDDIESRPFTPEDITNEMVERGRSAYWGPTYGGNVNERVRAILTAALTEPPKRPEGAERWEDFLIDSLDYQALTDQQIADLADRIAEEMNR